MNNQMPITAIIAIALSSFNATGRPPADRPDPESAVANIMVEFDANADNLLNASELEIAIGAMRQKRLERREAFAEKRRTSRGRIGAEDRPEPPSAATVADKLMADFDTNGDEHLDTNEMFTAAKAIHANGPRGKRGFGGEWRRSRGGPDIE